LIVMLRLVLEETDREPPGRVVIGADLVEPCGDLVGGALERRESRPGRRRREST